MPRPKAVWTSPSKPSIIPSERRERRESPSIIESLPHHEAAPFLPVVLLCRLYPYFPCEPDTGRPGIWVAPEAPRTTPTEEIEYTDGSQPLIFGTALLENSRFAQRQGLCSPFDQMTTGTNDWLCCWTLPQQGLFLMMFI